MLRSASDVARPSDMDVDGDVCHGHGNECGYCGKGWEDVRACGKDCEGLHSDSVQVVVTGFCDSTSEVFGQVIPAAPLSEMDVSMDGDVGHEQG